MIPNIVNTCVGWYISSPDGEPPGTGFLIGAHISEDWANETCKDSGLAPCQYDYNHPCSLLRKNGYTDFSTIFIGETTLVPLCLLSHKSRAMSLCYWDIVDWVVKPQQCQVTIFPQCMMFQGDTRICPPSYPCYYFSTDIFKRNTLDRFSQAESWSYSLHFLLFLWFPFIVS